MKNYDEWNKLKKQLDIKSKIVTPKEREVYWVSIGENIGFEQNGKGKEFSRPVLVVTKFLRSMFFGIPLSTKIKQGSYFHEFTFLDKQSSALIVQGRLFDTKRLEIICKEDFANIKDKLRNLLDV